MFVEAPLINNRTYAHVTGAVSSELFVRRPEFGFTTPDIVPGLRTLNYPGSF